jgi:hypothetical protein
MIEKGTLLQRRTHCHVTILTMLLGRVLEGMPTLRLPALNALLIRHQAYCDHARPSSNDSRAVLT